MNSLVPKMIIWMREWRIRQRDYEYLEAEAEQQIENLMIGLGILSLIAGMLIAVWRYA